MTDSAPSRLQLWLPYASLLITIAAFSAGAPAKLAHLRRRAAPPLLAENGFRDEPSLFSLEPETRVWRGYNALTFRTMIALK